MLCYYTRVELLDERIKLLNKLKFKLRKSTNKREAFNTFKRLCRDRVFDSLAGHCETKDGVFHWYNGGY